MRPVQTLIGVFGFIKTTNPAVLRSPGSESFMSLQAQSDDTREPVLCVVGTALPVNANLCDAVAATAALATAAVKQSRWDLRIARTRLILRVAIARYKKARCVQLARRERYGKFVMLEDPHCMHSHRMALAEVFPGASKASLPMRFVASHTPSPAMPGRAYALCIQKVYGHQPKSGGW